MYWILIGIAIGIVGAAAGCLLQKRPHRSDEPDQLDRTFSWANRLIESLLDSRCDQDSTDRMFLEAILDLADVRAVLMLEAADTTSVVYRSPMGLPARAKVVHALITIPGGIESPKNWQHTLLEWNWLEEQSSEEQEPCWIPEYRVISSDAYPPEPFEYNGFWLISCLLDSTQQGWIALCGNSDNVKRRISILEDFVRNNLDSRSIIRETIGLQQLMVQTFHDSKHAQVLIKDETICYFNSGFMGLTGYPHDELLGQSFHKTILHEDIPELQQYVLEQKNDAFPSDHLEIRMVHQDGLQFHVRLTPTKVSYQGSDALVMMIEDISPRINLEQRLMDKCVQQELIINGMMETKSKAVHESVDELKQKLSEATIELKQKNEELNRFNGELKNLDIMKDSFISAITHELLASLTPIKGSVSMIMDGKAGKVTPNIRQFLAVCLHNATQLIKMTNNLLDISKIESGRIKFNPIECHLKTIVSESIEELADYSEDSTVKLNIEVSDELMVWADRDWMVQVLQNLLSNALKFTEVGEVTVRASKLNEAVQIEIKDTGIGIPPEKLDTIFDKFTQIDKPDVGDVDGSGLGLAVCDSIIKKHNGTITVKSELGVGSCFSVILPDRDADSLQLQLESSGISESTLVDDGAYQMLNRDGSEGDSD